MAFPRFSARHQHKLNSYSVCARTCKHIARTWVLERVHTQVRERAPKRSALGARRRKKLFYSLVRDHVVATYAMQGPFYNFTRSFICMCIFHWHNFSYSKKSCIAHRIHARVFGSVIYVCIYRYTRTYSVHSRAVSKLAQIAFILCYDESPRYP